MKKRKNNIFVFFFFLICISFKGYSQHFIFELTPGMKFYGIGFQKTTGQITQGGNNTYAFTKINRVHSYDYNGFNDFFGIEPELNISILELNKKWKLNLGITTYSVKSKLSANTTGKSYLANADSSTLYTEYITKQLVNRYNQFSVSATRTFSTKTKLDKVFLNKLTVGFGVNRPSLFNTRNEKEFYVPYLYDSYGYVKEVTFKKSPFWGFLTPALHFKYEIMFQSKKHTSGLFSMYVSYIQGFSKQYSFNLTSSSIGGASLNLSSQNKGSGIRFGISKTFKYSKQTHNE